MGTYLTSSQFAPLHPNLFVFDLEYVGFSSNLNECYIWDIAVIHLKSNSMFQTFVKPDIETIPPPFSSEFIHVTHDFLKEKQAIHFKLAFDKLMQFIMTNAAPGPVVFIAHNVFKSDQKMIEIECKRCNLKLPYSIFFFDSLIFCRLKLQKQPSYTLSDIYFYLFQKKIINQHYAISDTLALRDVMLKLNIMYLEGPIYPAFTTSLQNIKWLGPSSEKLMFLSNIRSVESLVQNIVNAYSTALINFYQLNFQQFIELYICEQFHIKKGNSISISKSLIQGNYFSGV